MDPQTIATAVADWLADGEIEGLEGTADHEPKSLPATPYASIMTAGFARRGLDGNEVQGSIIDPIGARSWVWEYNLRIWVSLKTDEEQAQREMNALVPAVVRRLEETPLLGGVGLDDLAVASGVAGIANDQSGPAAMLMDMSLSVTWTEARD